MPPLKNIIRQRFPASRIADEEFITALDGKKRLARLEEPHTVVPRYRPPDELRQFLEDL